MKRFLFVTLLATLCGAALAQWKYPTFKNAFTDKVTKVAVLTSPTKLHFAFPYRGGTSGRLQLWPESMIEDRPMLVALVIDSGQLMADEGVAFNFDDAEIAEFNARSANDGSTHHAFLEFPGLIKGCMSAPDPIVVDVRDLAAALRQKRVTCEITEAQFIERLMAAKRVRVQAKFYQEGSQTFEFKPQGLKWPP